MWRYRVHVTPATALVSDRHAMGLAARTGRLRLCVASLAALLLVLAPTSSASAKPPVDIPAEVVHLAQVEFDRGVHERPNGSNNSPDIAATARRLPVALGWPPGAATSSPTSPSLRSRSGSTQAERGRHRRPARARAPSDQLAVRGAQRREAPREQPVRVSQARCDSIRGERGCHRRIRGEQTPFVNTRSQARPT